MVSYHISTWHYKPEDNLSHHNSEGLNSPNNICFSQYIMFCELLDFDL